MCESEPVETEILPCRYLSDLVSKFNSFCLLLYGDLLRPAIVVELHLQKTGPYSSFCCLFSQVVG